MPAKPKRAMRGRYPTKKVVTKRKAIGSIKARVAGKKLQYFGGLRALSIKGPDIAAAILSGQKRIENRSRKLPGTVQHGWIAIHTSARPARLGMREYVRKAWNPKGKKLRQWSPLQDSTCPLPQASIVGFAHIAGFHKLKPGERKRNPWALGPYCWELDGAVVLNPPIEGVIGQAGLWKIENESSISPSSRARLQRALQKLPAR